jgi:hypothetical protein
VESRYGEGTTFTVWLPVRFAPTEPGFGEPHAVKLGTGH